MNKTSWSYKGSMPLMIKILVCVREIYMAQTCWHC
jgi:hypothetical protein